MKKVSVKKRESSGGKEEYEEIMELDNKVEEDQAGYSSLQKPPEDIYAEATFATKTADKQAQGGMQRFRVGCLILSLVCLVLLLVVIVLCVKAGSTDRRADSYVVNQCGTCKGLQRAPESPNGCPTGWLRLDQSCFYLSTLRLNWEDSRRNCSVGGGSLAVVSSRDVQNFLTQKGNGLWYWIGLRLTGGTWTWVNNNVLEQSYWGKKDSKGECGLLISKEQTENNWMGYKCESHSYFVCQQPLEQHPQPFQEYLRVPAE
ncbi:snaclec 27 [Nerophis ophidion]|uniref:snaclec 27 n=1 Tax=Nerophis ophidion TaxID=159077 RepID=UPI002ADF3B1F|nr:snaclec 27 [Nerophis ophidion]